MDIKTETYWSKRAETFDKLQWANDQALLNSFIKTVDPQKYDVILDVGTGTGIVAHALQGEGREVVGIDTEPAMLEIAREKGNCVFLTCDVRNMPYEKWSFDIVTARYVFHHIMTELDRAFMACYNVLTPFGKLVISEGVPPDVSVIEEFTEIFKLKEERNVFTGDTLFNLMVDHGFMSINVKDDWLRGMSVKKWIQNSKLPRWKEIAIFNLHKNGSAAFKEAYNLVETEDDILIDCKVLTLVGEK